MCIRDRRGVIWYASKYLAKEADEELEVGRWWGVYGRENLPIELVTIPLRSLEVFFRLRRFLLRAAGLSHLKKWLGVRGVTVFVSSDTALRLIFAYG